MSVICRQCSFENADGAVFCAQCQATVVSDIEFLDDLEPLPDDLEDLVREALAGKVRILKEVGRGGMAVVYEGLELELNRKVAVKCLPLEKSIDKGLVQRFHMEAKVAASLNHPNIVPIYSVGTLDRIHFFTMAYFTGGSLEDLIEKGVSLKETVEIVTQIASALDYAHKKNLVHRDIKPSNVMFDEDGNVRVLDFGVARLLHEARLTITRAILGTPEYMSPEQALSKELDGRSDLYALGTIFYQMVTGRLPFTADEPLAMIYKHVNERPVAPYRINENVPLPLSRIILKLMAKDPDKRFATGGELVEALKSPELLAALQPGGSTGTTTLTMLDQWQRTSIGVKFACVAFPILLLLTWLFWPQARVDAQSPVPDVAIASSGTPENRSDDHGDSSDLGGAPAFEDAIPNEDASGNEEVSLEGENTHQAAEEPAAARVTSKPKPEKSKPKPKKVDPLPDYMKSLIFLDVFPESFRMGGRLSGKDALPAHKVSLSPFRMGATEVTQELWGMVMTEDLSCIKGKSYPVTNVSWDMVDSFVKKLNKRLGTRYRLPTEAEWEYVAKTGRKGPYGVLSLDGQGWYDKNASSPQPVGGKSPNSLGFYDIQGNVWEWCSDYYSPDYYKDSPEDNPQGPETGTTRVLRGGSFSSDSADCKPQRRHSMPPDMQSCAVGFRLVHGI